MRMPSGDVVEFGGWPRPPRWLWAVAAVAAVAVLVSVAVARAGPHRPVASPHPGSPTAAPWPPHGPHIPAGGSAAPWSSIAITCGSIAYLPQIRLAQQHAGSHVRVLIVARSCGMPAAAAPSH